MLQEHRAERGGGKGLGGCQFDRWPSNPLANNGSGDTKAAEGLIGGYDIPLGAALANGNGLRSWLGMTFAACNFLALQRTRVWTVAVAAASAGKVLCCLHLLAQPGEGLNRCGSGERGECLIRRQFLSFQNSNSGCRQCGERL